MPSSRSGSLSRDGVQRVCADIDGQGRRCGDPL